MSRLFRSGPGRTLSLVCASVLIAAASTVAHASTHAGGASYSPPALTGATCAADENQEGCPQGARLRLKGENLEEAEAVTFLGRKGRRDNRRAEPLRTSPHRVVVRVPSRARSGRVRVTADHENATGPRVTVVAPAPSEVKTTSADGGVFPIRGKHDFGTATNGFGGGRGHQGQDVFARCGKRVVAALPGKVTLAKWQDRAGNYAVIKADDGTSQVYMHLLEPAEVAAGDRIEAGQRIGQVGQTGRASGCHLHFELWTAPGWYEGGEAIDPLPALKRWDAAS